MAAGMDSVSLLLEAAGLFVAPFLHESLAFVGGAFLVHSRRMSLLMCLAVLLAGVIASDLAIYGLGRLARTHPRIAALLPAGARPAAVLSRHMLWLIPVCRFVPGLLFTTFTACGMLGLSFRRFAAVTMLTAAVYTPLLLWAVLRFGDAVAARDELWRWFAILAALFGLTAMAGRLVERLMKRRTAWPAG
jgi:membrane protein DedA with SNARE-associated domain